jgi:EmrB/QacA subfamily drug resistance transporter
MRNISSAHVDRKSVLLVAVLSSFLTPFMGSSINIILPAINRQYALNALELSWIATAFLLAAAVFLVPMGRLGDIKGRKAIYRIGIIIDVISSILCAFPPSGEWLIYFRVLEGVGGAMIYGTSTAMLTSAYPVDQRGKVLGINVAAVYAGLSVGPLVGGFFGQQFGWRSVFILNAFLALVIVVIVFWKLKGEWADAKGEKFDMTGSVFYGLSLIAIVYGFSALTNSIGIWFIAAGIIMMVVFVFWELRQTQPVLQIQLFIKNRVFAFSNLAALINYSATFAANFLLSLYLQDIKGLSIVLAGLVLMIQPVVMVICSLIAGRLSDRYEPGVIAAAGMAFTTIGLIILRFLTGNSSMMMVIISLVVLGIGFGFFTSPNTNAIMSSVERKYYGVASGMMGTMRLLGQTFSLGIVTLLFALLIGAVQIAPANYPQFLKSLQISFTVAACLCFLGIFASALRGNIHPDSHHESEKTNSLHKKPGL